MIFNHMVKFNGKFYKAGEDVPNGASSNVEKEVVVEPKEEIVTEQVETAEVEEKPKRGRKAKV